MYAAQNNRLEITKLLIDSGADLNAKNRYGNTALIRSVLSKSPETAKLLIEAGADLNIQNDFSDTALIKATEDNSIEMASLLINAGADLNIKKNGYTALILTEAYNRNDIIKLIKDTIEKEKKKFIIA